MPDTKPNSPIPQVTDWRSRVEGVLPQNMQARVLGAFNVSNLLGVAAVLTFVGAKMLLGSVYIIPIHVSLIVIVAVLAISVVASMMFPEEKNGA